MANSESRPERWNELPRFAAFSKNRDEILNVRAEIAKRQSRIASLIDRGGKILAHPPFFLTLLAIHAGWFLLNLPIMPWKAWDPYPFMLLATIASAEAPLISLLILMRQHRDARIDELREEIDLQVALHVEREMTAMLRLMSEVQEKLEIQTRIDRNVLYQMEQPLDAQHLMQRLQAHLDEAEGRQE